MSMTAEVKMPGHLRQQVPGSNSNPTTQEGEAVMPIITDPYKPPMWAGRSEVYHSDEEPVAAEHHGPVAGVLDGGRIVMNVRVSQIVLKDGTVEDPMVRIDQDEERAFEFPLRLARRLIAALGDLEEAMGERAGVDFEGAA